MNNPNPISIASAITALPIAEVAAPPNTGGYTSFTDKGIPKEIGVPTGDSDVDLAVRCHEYGHLILRDIQTPLDKYDTPDPIRQAVLDVNTNGWLQRHDVDAVQYLPLHGVRAKDTDENLIDRILIAMRSYGLAKAPYVSLTDAQRTRVAEVQALASYATTPRELEQACDALQRFLKRPDEAPEGFPGGEGRERIPGGEARERVAGPGPGPRKDPERKRKEEEKLSPREKEILDMIREDMRTTDIAKKLKIGSGTVSHYKESMKKKLELSSYDELKSGVGGKTEEAGGFGGAKAPVEAPVEAPITEAPKAPVKAREIPKRELDDILSRIAEREKEREEKAKKDALRSAQPQRPMKERKVDFRDPKWMSMELVRPVLQRRLKQSRDYGKSMRPSHSGAFVYPLRALRGVGDGKVFANVQSGKKGSMLIDFSGSMSLKEKDVMDILQAAPRMTVAMYCGNTKDNHGQLTVLAKQGRVVAQKDIKRYGIANGIDGPALEWLSKQSGPRYWICDGGVTGIQDHFVQELQDRCYRIAKMRNIKRFDNIRDFLKLKLT